MTLLDKIIEFKRTELKELKKRRPVSVLEKSLLFQRPTHSLSSSILNKRYSGIIAEFKRKSPSAGVLNSIKTAHEVAQEYYRAGASAVSVLTDSLFFGGSIDDLSAVSTRVKCPVLRKDFIIDEYQVFEAKSYGADAILLISEVLTPGDLYRLHKLALNLGLEVLVEIHEKKNIDAIPAETRIIGVNNRNLATLSSSLRNSEDLLPMLPATMVKVAESGIHSVSEYLKLKEAGYQGFLIGEHFMRNSDPGQSCLNFINEINGRKN